MKVRNDLLVALMAVIAVASSASPAGADVRATDPVAGYGRYVAAMPPAAPMSLYVSLPGRHPAEIDGLIAAQNTPGSRYFHHYLTPQAYGAYFGADPGRLSAAIAALRYHGFVVDQVLANRRDLIVHAPASVVESYFQTPIDLRNDGQRSFYAAHYIPQPHGALEGANVSGLESYRRLNDHHRMNPHVRVGRVDAWGPSDIQSVYDLLPIYATATGAGITVVDATIGLARKTDFAGFNKRFGLNSQLISTQVGTRIPFDFNGETTIDVEWISAVAPDATVDQVSPAQNTDNDFDKMYAYIVNSMSSAHLVTTSWGACEGELGKHLRIDENLMQQAAAEGQWWLAAAGDEGSDDCGNGIKSVDFPGSSPYVVSVGGTEVTPEHIADNKYKGWKNEVTWEVHGDGASGGGASKFFAKPAFQTALTPPDGVRDVPDVSLMSDDTDANGGYFVYFRALWRKGWGGTSFAAPEWAGYLALIAQQHGGTISSPLMTFYQLAGSGQYSTLFHDITAGCNGFREVHGYCATIGYDQASGLGSFIGANLAGAY